MPHRVGSKYSDPLNDSLREEKLKDPAFSIAPEYFFCIFAALLAYTYHEKRHSSKELPFRCFQGYLL